MEDESNTASDYCNRSRWFFLEENPGAICILSGGQGECEDRSEAECIYRYLIDKGIDKERLYMKDTSTTTEENLKNAKALLECLNLGNEIAMRLI